MTLIMILAESTTEPDIDNPTWILELKNIVLFGIYQMFDLHLTFTFVEIRWCPQCRQALITLTRIFDKI